MRFDFSPMCTQCHMSYESHIEQDYITSRWNLDVPNRAENVKHHISPGPSPRSSRRHFEVGVILHLILIMLSSRKALRRGITAHASFRKSRSFLKQH